MKITIYDAKDFFRSLFRHFSDAFSGIFSDAVIVPSFIGNLSEVSLIIGSLSEDMFVEFSSYGYN